MAFDVIVFIYYVTMCLSSEMSCFVFVFVFGLLSLSLSVLSQLEYPGQFRESTADSRNWTSGVLNASFGVLDLF